MNMQISITHSTKQMPSLLEEDLASTENESVLEVPERGQSERIAQKVKEKEDDELIF